MLKRFLSIVSIMMSVELAWGDGGFQLWKIMFFLYNCYIPIPHVLIVFITHIYQERDMRYLYRIAIFQWSVLDAFVWIGNMRLR